MDDLKNTFHSKIVSKSIGGDWASLSCHCILIYPVAPFYLALADGCYRACGPSFWQGKMVSIFDLKVLLYKNIRAHAPLSIAL